jgi:DNA adenine methylase
MKNNTFNTKAGHVDEDGIHEPTFNELVSCLSDDHQQLFLGILSANNLDQSTFEYHMLFNLLALPEFGKARPLEYKELIKKLQFFDIHDHAAVIHELTFDDLVSYLPDDHKQLFIGILSANNLDQSTFEYHMLFDLLALQEFGNASPLEHSEIINELQDIVSGIYNFNYSPSDYVTHGHGYIESVVNSDRYRTVSINPDYQPPISYMGNKKWLTKLITEKKVIIPQHKLWIEPFCGSASMTLAQENSPAEIINDYDRYLINFYTVLSQPASRQILLDQLSHYLMMPKTRELHLPLLGKLAKKTMTASGSGEKRVTKDISISSADDITLARAYYICAKINYGNRSLGYLDDFQYAENSSKNVTIDKMKMWLETLESAGKRLESVIIQQGDGLSLIRQYLDDEDVFFYIDPPYVINTRQTQGDDYAAELTDDNHRELVDLLLTIKGSAILSGYNTQLYLPLERDGWKTISHVKLAGEKYKEEMLWIKP